MAKQYAVLRNGKLNLQSGKWGKVAGADNHNQRLNHEEYAKKYAAMSPEEQAKQNVDPARTKFNKSYNVRPEPDLISRIKGRIAEANITRKIADDAVVGREVIMTTSPEYWGTDWQSKIETPEFNEKLNAWVKASMAAAEAELGKDNIVQADLHMDEKTPHLQIIATPIMERDGKNRLCAKEMMSKKNLIDFQTNYAKAMAQFGLERGVEGSQAKHKHFKDFAKEEALKVELRKEVQAEVNQQTIYAAVATERTINIDESNRIKYKYNELLHDYEVLKDKYAKAIEDRNTATAKLKQSQVDYSDVLEHTQTLIAQAIQPYVKQVKELETDKEAIIEDFQKRINKLHGWIQRFKTEQTELIIGWQDKDVERWNNVVDKWTDSYNREKAKHVFEVKDEDDIQAEEASQALKAAIAEDEAETGRTGYETSNGLER